MTTSPQPAGLAPATSSDPAPAPPRAEEAQGSTQGCGCGCSADSRMLPLVAPDLPADTPRATARPAADTEPGDLDLRGLPSQERDTRLVEAVAALLPGEGLVLAADQDPAPLREVLDQEGTGNLGWQYLAEGPQVWRVLVNRETCC